MRLARLVRAPHQLTKEPICALNADANVQKLNQLKVANVLAQPVKEVKNEQVHQSFR